MALSTLVVERLERFGGIDLKKNYRKYFSNALGASIGLHLLAILLYAGWAWYSSSEAPRRVVIPHDPAVFVAPPSIQANSPELSSIIPAFAQRMMRQDFGTFVPVPDAIDPKLTLPDMSRQAAQIVDPGPVGKLEIPGNMNINSHAHKADPSIDTFIPISVEPQETQPLEELIVYPEVARRSGLEGTVMISALIGENGDVKKVVPIKWDYDIFRDAAIAAMMKQHFTPALQDHTPVPVWITRTVHFKLNGK